MMRGAGYRRDIWVVFTDHTDLFWLKILKRGFRHCYILMYDGMHWTSYDPLASHTEIMFHHDLPDDFDFIAHVEMMGDIAVPALVKLQGKAIAPPAFFTCVEAVKRILGLHSVLTWTPWQLYKYLTKQNSLDHKKEIQNGKFDFAA